MAKCRSLQIRGDSAWPIVSDAAPNVAAPTASRPPAPAVLRTMDEWVYPALLHPQIPTYPSDFRALPLLTECLRIDSLLNAPIRECLELLAPNPSQPRVK